MHFDAEFWHGHFERTLPNEMHQIIDALKSRILPQFENITAEAVNVSNSMWNHPPMDRFSEDADMSDLAEAATEAGYEHYALMSGLCQGIVNMFAASLFHLHEQHLMLFYKRQLHDMRTPLDRASLRPTMVISKLEIMGIDVKGMKSWAALYEIESLANSVKHGDGRSAQNLKEKRPDFFKNPNQSDLLEAGDFLALDKPILGDGLYVKPSDLDGIKNAIVNFWRELFSEMKKLEATT